MAQTINRNNYNFSVGTDEFVIDGLPPNSVGFRVILERHPAWDAMTGRMMRAEIHIAVDGVTYKRWITAELLGGPAPIGPDGAPVAVWALGGTWPGENDGSGGRRVLRAINLKAVIQVDQAFTTPNVSVYTV